VAATAAATLASLFQISAKQLFRVQLGVEATNVGGNCEFMIHQGGVEAN